MPETTTPIYTALNVPTVTAYPSTTCLQWSPDGQAYLTTKSAVYIMTPDHGINFDARSSIKSFPPKQEPDEKHSLSWFKTAVQISTSSIDYHWADYSTVWGAVSLGSIDVDLMATTVSPSDVSPRGGCVVAILSSNMDITLWTAGKNGLKGEWIKIFDVIPFLLRHFEAMGSTAMTLKCQVTCISWSSQADFGIIPNPVLNASLLILGTRAGSIHFLRYTAPSSTVELVASIVVSDKWVTQVSASPFALTQSGTCECTVAFATEDGGVGLVRVRQTLVACEVASSLGFGRQLMVELTAADTCIIPPDFRVVTALSWITLTDDRQVLLALKPGFLYLWIQESTSSSWVGLKCLPLQTVRMSVGSSPRYPPSGIQHLKHQDALLISTYDGCFHVLQNLSTEPAWLDWDESRPSSDGVSNHIRTLCSRVEGKTMQFSDMTRISGSMSYDGHNTIMWTHEIHRPSEFLYKQGAKMMTRLVVADIGPEPTVEDVEREMQRVLTDFTPGQAPISVLRPSLIHIRRTQEIKELYPKLLEILDSPFKDQSGLMDIPSCKHSLSPQVRGEFRESLRRQLFGWKPLLSLRMRLSVADFLWKLGPDPEAKISCGDAAQTLLTFVSHMNLRTLIRHTTAVAAMLTKDDMPFVLRLIVQSMLPNTPDEIVSEGRNLTGIVQSITGTTSETFMSADAFKETCPACQEEVLLTDITKATCINKHSWGRCSITTFILSTSYVRSCIGCTRKAFLPISSAVAVDGQTPTNWLPEVGRGWVVEELLEGINHCLFCGNSFVSVL